MIDHRSQVPEIVPMRDWHHAGRRLVIDGSSCPDSLPGLASVAQASAPRLHL
jgi:hypothetical protein